MSNEPPYVKDGRLNPNVVLDGELLNQVTFHMGEPHVMNFLPRKKKSEQEDLDTEDEKKGKTTHKAGAFGSARDAQKEIVFWEASVDIEYPDNTKCQQCIIPNVVVRYDVVKDRNKGECLDYAIPYSYLKPLLERMPKTIEAPNRISGPEEENRWDRFALPKPYKGSKPANRFRIALESGDMEFHDWRQVQGILSDAKLAGRGVVTNVIAKLRYRCNLPQGEEPDESTKWFLATTVQMFSIVSSLDDEGPAPVPRKSNIPSAGRQDKPSSFLQAAFQKHADEKSDDDSDATSESELEESDAESVVSDKPKKKGRK